MGGEGVRGDESDERATREGRGRRRRRKQVQHLLISSPLLLSIHSVPK